MLFSLLLKRFDFTLYIRLNSTGNKDLNANPCIWGKEMWKMSKEEGSKKGKESNLLLIHEQVTTVGN